jgi:hypothetical protein
VSPSSNPRSPVEWERWEGRKIRIAVVCHCGEMFPMYELDEARAHVASHEGEPEVP